MPTPRPIWISHRGLHDQATENTLAAFHAALTAGFDGLETDLRTTTDGQIFLCHDPSLPLGSGLDLVIAQSHSRNLLDVKLADGQSLARLEQFIDAFPTVLWTFDVKPEGGLATVAALTRLSKKPGLRAKLYEQARFLFWTKRDRDAFRKTFPDATYVAMEPECYRAGLAVLNHVPALGSIKRGMTYALPPTFAGIHLYRKSFIRRYQDRGARVVAYLPRTRDEFAAAVAAGVDEILSDGFIDKSLNG